ncbi:hypothetical protein ACVWWI_006746 [Bradyrhizobium sp. USDA 3686]|uniref:hypothetical protein n=1 Tax=Bradyrhizobium TaxID=374 RepID=UPI00195B1C57|nr:MULTISPECIES: hypothetical protein [Bradyrhizobium]MBM7487696.1 hypothetical protein [Bradyrhizobium canariense]MCS3764831.1 hypothetical protein [Bradyrhizobium centrosematis]MCS3776119.1 hypothetical protein [Bradyrhizobium centrosematis]UFW71489.1 hypothetical protein BcanWU425_33565 [Bradyrhizobium canariense]
MDRLKRITELVAEKTSIDNELKTLKEQITQETAALKKPRATRKKKGSELQLVNQ